MPCPQCGGSRRRVIAPGFYECLSEVIVDYVAPGMHGNMTSAAMPVPGLCGHRYQEAAGVTTTTQCDCGMFAIGTCQTCGAPRCGDHGALWNGSFVCLSHRAEAAAARVADEERRKADELDKKTAAKARHRAIKQSLAPGFPEGVPTPMRMSEALAQLVPDRTCHCVTERKSRLRGKSVTGWLFRLPSGITSSNVSARVYHLRVLVITTDGAALTAWTPSAEPVEVLTAANLNQRGWVWEPKHQLTEDESCLIFAQVLE